MLSRSGDGSWVKRRRKTKTSAVSVESHTMGAALIVNCLETIVLSVCPSRMTPSGFRTLSNYPTVFGKCQHIFHMHCILKWIGTTNSQQQCPLDRRPWGESWTFTGTLVLTPLYSTRRCRWRGYSGIRCALNPPHPKKKLVAASRCCHEPTTLDSATRRRGQTHLLLIRMARAIVPYRRKMASVDAFSDSSVTCPYIQRSFTRPTRRFEGSRPLPPTSPPRRSTLPTFPSNTAVARNLV
jgi:hypothetical protein